MATAFSRLRVRSIWRLASCLVFAEFTIDAISRGNCFENCIAAWEFAGVELARSMYLTQYRVISVK
jgi:hypothetical protein